MTLVEVQQIARFLSGFGFTVVSWQSSSGRLRLTIEVPDDEADMGTESGDPRMGDPGD